ncbi:hypothetical protein F4V57_04900 [Acinetobacter qingfengensis]|uniref:hypothetical protein n=1 Tax=Acinetobacter qingfengensis TaxID=1262585 RepID=UPI00123A866F|nr:hypothetical protein [Acinetobacter qingfengensis]KAA8735094.1 hypothetical protein F4V57_04900 [Acinetobacter qingfengensis]
MNLLKNTALIGAISIAAFAVTGCASTHDSQPADDAATTQTAPAPVESQPVASAQPTDSYAPASDIQSTDPSQATSADSSVQ